MKEEIEVGVGREVGGRPKIGVRKEWELDETMEKRLGNRSHHWKRLTLA